MSDPLPPGVYGIINEGGTVRRTFDGVLEVINPDTGDARQGRVVRGLNRNGGEFTEHRSRGQVFEGHTPSPEVLSRAIEANRSATPAARPSGSNEQNGTASKRIHIRVRLHAQKCIVQYTFPTNAKVKDVINRIKQETGILVELRIDRNKKECKLENPEKLLTEENIESGALLQGHTVQEVVTQYSPVSAPAIGTNGRHGTPI